MVKKKVDDRDQKIAELTADLQRVRADFENYRKRVEIEKQQASERGEARTALKLLPVIDTIERATLHIPKEIVDNPWVQGVAGLTKQLEKALSDIGIVRIDASVGVVFNPEVHQAVQFDEDSVGDTEVVAEELQAGYTLGGLPIRHAMVKVSRQ